MKRLLLFATVTAALAGAAAAPTVSAAGSVCCGAGTQGSSVTSPTSRGLFPTKTTYRPPAPGSKRAAITTAGPTTR